MKRRDLLARLAQKGFTLVRHGKKHDVYGNAQGRQEPIPRHAEIDERLAKAILKKHGA